VAERIEFLDGLRGVAASLVLIGHVAEQICATVSAPVIDRALDYAGLGRIGVVAFFCISGFVIPFSFRSPNAVRNFAISRFFRLYPAYWLSLAAILALGALLGIHYPAVQIAANVTMAQAALGQADMIAVYWTLFYELVFYLACAAAFSLGWLARPRAVLLLVLALSLAAATFAVLRFIDFPVKPPLGLPGYLAIMFFGTCCRFAFLKGDAEARRWLPAALAIIFAMVAAVALLGHAQGPLPERPIADFIGVYLGAAMFLLAFRAKALLSRPAMIWLGNISYSLYLMHVACVIVCATLAAFVSSDIAKVAILLAGIPLSLLVAHLCALWVEKPMIRLGKQLIKRGRRAPIYEGIEPAP
jgi:peptidoglycan/LPS O-acetylase OafA/YrhL